MHNTRNTTEQSEKGRMTAIVRNLLLTKIQFVEEQLHYLQLIFDELQSIDLQREAVRSTDRKLRQIKAKLDDYIKRSERLHHAQELLLLIKNYLSDHTAKAIYELLDNDKYQFFTADSLARLLGLESYLYQYAPNPLRN